MSRTWTLLSTKPARLRKTPTTSPTASQSGARQPRQRPIASKTNPASVKSPESWSGIADPAEVSNRFSTSVICAASAVWVAICHFSSSLP